MKVYRNAGRLFLVLALVMLATNAVLADSNYDEGVDGDLSGDRFNPTALTLSAGSNVLTATSVVGDLEYVTVHVPSGMQLDAIILTEYISEDDVSFIGLQSGNTFTEPPTGTNVANLLGWSHFGAGAGQVGSDILQDIGDGGGAIGFIGPLPSGDYTFWIQEIGAAAATYTLDMRVLPAVSNVVYEEETDGDLSGDGLMPTAVSLDLGSNFLIGATVAGDLDYVTVSIPTHMQLDAILLTDYVSVDDVSFIAVQAGATFTEPPTGTDVNNLLGWSHFGAGAGQVGTDILDDMGVGGGAIGFSGPLPAGDYTFWIQETGMNSVSYTLDFVASPAPPTVAYDEATDGDLSGDMANPTRIFLVPGGNLLTATSVAGDIEYVTFTVPPEYQLEAMVLESFESVDDVSFIAIQRGDTFTEPPTGTDPANLLGWSHFGAGAGQVGRDILGDMGMGAGAQGFYPPLPAGDYTLWIQETGADSATYTLNFVLVQFDHKVFLPVVRK
ncbi:MAG: hypothetical protein AAF614_13085 [Chloroflexota bacterium]